MGVVLIQVFVSWVCLGALAGTPDTKAEKTQVDHLEILFNKALPATGKAYVEARNAYCVQAKKGLADKFLAERRKKAKTWQETLLLDILKEHIEREGKPNPLLKLDPRSGARRGWDLVVFYGCELANKGGQVPMFIAESLWKDNELNQKKWLKTRNAPAYLMEALGLLKEARARVLIEGYLFVTKNKSKIKGTAADALGEIGSDKSVPALLRASVSTNYSIDNAADAAVEALASCMSRGTLQQVEQFAEKTKDKELKDDLNFLVKQFRKSLKEAEGKPKATKVAPETD